MIECACVRVFMRGCVCMRVCVVIHVFMWCIPVVQTDAQWVEMQKAQTAQLQLLKDMLSAETASRIDAQVSQKLTLRLCTGKKLLPEFSCLLPSSNDVSSDKQCWHVYCRLHCQASC